MLFCTLNNFTRNGVDKSGLYCVISAVIERLQIEQDVAISQVIEEMRSAREQIIPSVVSIVICEKNIDKLDDLRIRL
jgi:hypothetical protein